MAQVKIENDNRNLLLNELEDRVKVALRAVGMQAVTDVVKVMRKSTTGKKDSKGRYIGKGYVVDTGLLKNSMTFAVSGESPNISSYSADEGTGSGAYSGKAPEDKVPAVYIGTNVEYGKYVQFGTSKMRPRDFLISPLRANLGKYKETITEYLKRG